MSVESDVFLIGVTGSRERVFRMLNAAIRSVGGGDLIVEGDDVETVNRKLDFFIGINGHNISVFDLLDEECGKDGRIQGKMAMAERPRPDRYIEIVRVEESAMGYTVKFSSYLFEDIFPEDWADWDDIARLYGCYVFIDDMYQRNGKFVRFESTTVYEPGGEMRRFESGSSKEELDAFIDMLAERYPERYVPMRERYLGEDADEPEPEIEPETSQPEECGKGAELIDENGHADIPEGMRKIPADLFFKCGNLKSVTFPKGVQTIACGAFSFCENLTSVELPEGLTTIGRYAFYGCTGLTHVVFPKSLRAVAHWAFKDCPALDPDTLSKIQPLECDDVVYIVNTAYILGPKEVIVDVLNRALSIFGSKNRIVVDADDDLKAMEQKVFESHDLLRLHGSDMTLMDFLDTKNRMESPCQMIVFSYIDEPDPDGSEDYSVVMHAPEKIGEEYMLDIYSSSYETQYGYLDEDWQDWCERMVRLYGCRVIWHRCHEGGNADSSDAWTFESDGASVKQTPIADWKTVELELHPGWKSPEPEDGLPF